MSLPPISIDLPFFTLLEMKDLYFLLLETFRAYKMKKGFKNMCTGNASTSTLNQKNSPELVSFPESNSHSQQPTLEEMIKQLDLEEKMASRQSLDHLHHRMSCVNSSDILRSARNALNQYPRFSLDGKDAMYRSSFRNFDHVTANIRNRPSLDRSRRPCLPAKVAGERVIWCKPSVVGKLMGLEAIPIPVRLKHRKNSCLVRKQNMRNSDRQAMERRKVDSNHGVNGSCSRPTTGYCVMKPVAVEIH
uniref:uncharacterized protein LOC122603323 n=1 Tax=Erigeron canadensis TaxID=72917 RepID=UPI001CB9B71C|nr:uncharacterized protein LOC122603323 [Erigeron canadensis]